MPSTAVPVPCTAARDDPAATPLPAVARRLALAEDVPALLQDVISAVPALVAAADRASASARQKGEPGAVAATDLPTRLSVVRQYELGEGPAVAAATGEQDIVLVTDLSAEDRWPRWRAGLGDQLPVGSLVSFRLDTGLGMRGSLTFYSARRGAFDGTAVGVGSALAVHATAALTAVGKRENLRLALGSRDIIGQAKGILMERHRLTADEAFALLIAASQRTNRKLRDVAEELALTGELPHERR